MGAEVPDLPAAIELGEVVAAALLHQSSPFYQPATAPISFARRRTGEMRKREENVKDEEEDTKHVPPRLSFFLGRREYRLGTIFVPALKDEGHVLSGIVVQGNLFKLDVKLRQSRNRHRGVSSSSPPSPPPRQSSPPLRHPAAHGRSSLWLGRRTLSTFPPFSFGAYGPRGLR
uniref:Uncharacterized protein n=1 Tax=Oryza barthii TaxID=65489 RepID=A0A0D3HCU3_9ORYZ